MASKRQPKPTPNIMPAPQDPNAPMGSAMNPNMASGPQPIDPMVGLVQEPAEKDPIKDILEGLDESKIDYLGSKAAGEFETCKAARLVQEETWLRCHQNEKGVYPSDMNFNGGTSKPFVQITRPKVMNAHARLVEVCLPPGEDAWSLDPSPKPFIPEIVTAMLAAGAMPEDILKTMKIEAEKASESMTLKVKDGLAETNWPSKLQETLLDMCLYGTSIMSGPFAVPSEADADDAKRSINRQLKQRLAMASKLFDIGMADEFRPEMEVVSPFHFYPDPGATRIEDCLYAIIRRVVNKSQLLDLAKTEGFRSEAIKEVIEASPEGNWTCESWESILNVTNSQQLMSMPNGRFVVLQRWGFLSGRDIKNAGIDVPDKQLDEQVMCQLWVTGGRVISLQVSELFRAKLPFYVTPYCLVPHCIWGSGPAEFMWDSQDGINACERAKYDSMALASIPQINVNVNRLAPGQDALEIKPGKIWATTDAPAGSTGKPIEFFTPPSIVADVQRVQQDAMAFCDEQTGLPRSLQGEGGQGIHNRTASGASMQFNSAITPLKGVAFNIDTKLISPMLRNMVKFYDKFSKDKSIVGDFQVVAKGVSGLMAREVVSQKLGNLMQAVSSSPELAKRIDMERVADLLMRGSGLQDSRLVLTEAEVLKREEAMQQQQQVAQAAGQQMQADIQAQSQHKMRAETSPRDVLLQALSEVPDKAVNLKLDMLGAVLAASGLLTPELQASIAIEKDKQQMMDQAMAEELGSKNGSGDMEIIKMQRAEQMKEKDREHAMEMMKLKNKSTNGASDAE